MIQTKELHGFLEDAISKLNSLVDYTKADIEDIKEAKHEVIFQRSNDKISMIKQFETVKSMIDNEILSLTKKYPHLKLSEILDDKASSLLTNMRNTLEHLKQINMHYARMAFAVSEFYNSITDRLIPKEKADYKSQVRQSSLLRIQV